MSTLTIDNLKTYGPERCAQLDLREAQAMCRGLAMGHYENFSVLSVVVPREFRDDFAALYAFCRWADDLGDEISDSERSLELLSWWRKELKLCFAGQPRHPVFVALQPVVERHELPLEPFDRLIQGFEQDQTVSRYETWEQLVDYCRLSADPVGRLVLMICGEERSDDLFRLSDDICTALQLTNHWQDIQRDILDRDRIYIPKELNCIDDFEDRLIRSAKQGYSVDHSFLGETRELVRDCVSRTWKLFERGEKLLEKIGPESKAIVWLLSSGGHHVLRQIELWNYETVLHRPKLGTLSRLRLVATAWFMARSARRRKAASP